MKRIITAAGAAYILLCIWGALMFTSCSTGKQCHSKKHYVAKNVLKAQSRPRR